MKKPPLDQPPLSGQMSPLRHVLLSRLTPVAMALAALGCLVLYFKSRPHATVEKEIKNDEVALVPPVLRAVDARSNKAQEGNPSSSPGVPERSNSTTPNTPPGSPNPARMSIDPAVQIAPDANEGDSRTNLNDTNQALAQTLARLKSLTALNNSNATVANQSSGNSPSVLIRDHSTIPLVGQTAEAMALGQLPVAATTALEGLNKSNRNQAVVDAHPEFLLPRGAVINCTLQTAIDSTLPGLTTCLISSDVYSADGTVVLLERGSQLVGETHADVKPGQARVGVQWTDARSANGIRFHIDSPSTDALGRTGLSGTVDRHTTDRLGAAALITLLESGSNALAQRFQRGTSVTISPQATTNVAGELLKDTLAQPPTIHVATGAIITVLATKDIDFSGVYTLDEKGRP